MPFRNQRQAFIYNDLVDLLFFNGCSEGQQKIKNYHIKHVSYRDYYKACRARLVPKIILFDFLILFV